MEPRSSLIASICDLEPYRTVRMDVVGGLASLQGFRSESLLELCLSSPPTHLLLN